MFSSLAGAVNAASGAPPSRAAAGVASRLAGNTNNVTDLVDWPLAAGYWKFNRTEPSDLYENLGKYCQEVSNRRIIAGAKSLTSRVENAAKYAIGFGAAKGAAKGAKTLASSAVSAFKSGASGVGRALGFLSAPASAVTPGRENGSHSCPTCLRSIPPATAAGPGYESALRGASTAFGAPAVNARTRSITQADARTVTEGTSYVKSFPHALGNSMRHPGKPGTVGKRKGRRSERKTRRRQRK